VKERVSCKKGFVMTKRKAEYPIVDMILQRWSPRALSDEPVTDDELMRLFEAARWAQSSYNAQPWRFVYAHHGAAEWGQFFDFLVPFNKRWADKAAVLIVVLSRKRFERNDKPSRTHSFDTGAACQNLALQGYAQGLVVHGMEGFDYDRARKELGVPEEYAIEALFAVGKPGKKRDLPQELQEREEPSDRKPLKLSVFKGSFNENTAKE